MNAGTPWLAGSGVCAAVIFAFVYWYGLQPASADALARAIASSDCVKVVMARAIGQGQLVTNGQIDTTKKSCEEIKKVQEILKKQQAVLEEPNPLLKKPNP